MAESEYSDGKVDDKSESVHQQSTLLGKPTTDVVNLKKHGKEGVTMIDRDTIFGNKFILEEDGGNYTREESIVRYREWFKKKIKKDPEFRKAVHNLTGEKLGCWCKPKPCHGDVILEYLRGQMEISPETWDSDEDEWIQTEITAFHPSKNE